MNYEDNRGACKRRKTRRASSASALDEDEDVEQANSYVSGNLFLIIGTAPYFTCTSSLLFSFACTSILRYFHYFLRSLSGFLSLLFAIHEEADGAVEEEVLKLHD